jgi:hypothetical protein
VYLRIGRRLDECCATGYCELWPVFLIEQGRELLMELKKKDLQEPMQKNFLI